MAKNGCAPNEISQWVTYCLKQLSFALPSESLASLNNNLNLFFQIDCLSCMRYGQFLPPSHPSTADDNLRFKHIMCTTQLSTLNINHIVPRPDQPFFRKMWFIVCISWVVEFSSEMFFQRECYIRYELVFPHSIHNNKVTTKQAE